MPAATSIVGVGSNTTQYVLDQLAANYDKTSATRKLYSWDATNPTTGAIGDNIVTKKGCTAIPRPDGSSAGITALDANTADGSNFCIDYARSSRARTATDPGYTAGGIAFTTLATDAITYATRASGTNAPASLTLLQLKNIYLCKTTNWDKVGGSAGTIDAFIPQSGSGTRNTFLLALGGGITPITPGACVSDLPTQADPGGTLEENEGINPALNDANAIFPYSIGAFVAQAYRSAPVSGDGITCTPAGAENKFGCDYHGVLTLDEINGSKPTNTFPLPAFPTPPAINTAMTINTHFTAAFDRTLFNVVRFDATTPDHIPAYLEPVFASAAAATPGFACAAAQAKVLKAYGFLTTPLCGNTD